MAMHIPCKFQTVDLECGHRAPVFTWLEQDLGEAFCRPCGQAKQVKPRQAQRTPAMSALPRRLASSRSSYMRKLAEELNAISLRYRAEGITEAEADELALEVFRRDGISIEPMTAQPQAVDS